MKYHNIMKPISFAALAWVSTLAHAQDNNEPLTDGQMEADAQPSAAPEAVHIDDQHQHDVADNAEPKQTVLLSGYGGGGFTISTNVPEAQAFFSNGMELGAAFAHQAAINAMKEAVRLDPACAMCMWGETFMSGPTLNYGSDKDERKPLLVMARKASKMARENGTPRERDLTKALVQRYMAGDVAKRDKAFHRAMELLAARYPQDDVIQVLTADASLVAASEEDEWKPAAVRAMELLEPVLARSPESTPAIHFYIHSSEIAGQSAKAEPFADRLADLAPRASHLVHMPSHTWYWLGRYQEAADTNMRAVRIDQGNAAMMGHDGEHGVFKLPYHAHNVIFGLGGAMMAEDSRTALTLARPLVASTQEREEGPPIMQLLSAAGYFALARFDDPASTLALSEPKLPYLKVAWHYARGEAYAFQKNNAGLAKEIAAIPEVTTNASDTSENAGDNEKSPAPDQMIGIVHEVLTGRLAMMEGRYVDAATAFRNAADIEETEDFSVFKDPPAFWYPVRRDLAAALFAQGDMEGGRTEAEAALELRPRDPVTLALLSDFGVPVEDYAALTSQVGKLDLHAQVTGRSNGSSDAQKLAGTLNILEEQSYAAWKSGDAKFWATFLSEKFVGWGRTGRLDKNAVESVMSGSSCQIGSYRLTDKQVSQLTPKAAVLTHRTEITGICDGGQLAPAYYTATVYVHEAGQWKAAFRAQSAIIDPMKATKPVASDIWTGGPTHSDAFTQTLLRREQAVWSAWKDHDAKRIDTLLGDTIQFIDIFGNHIATRPETLKAWSGEGCDVKSFDISGAKATMFAPDFGILTVRATTDGKCFGQDVWPIRGTSLYVKHGSTWLWSFGINVLAGSSL